MIFDMATLYEYSTTSIQFLFGLSFFVKFLRKKMKLFFYFLFGGCAVWVIYIMPNVMFISLEFYVLPGVKLAQLGVFALSLAAAGIFICHTDWKTSALYALLTVAIMQLGYGIVNSLLSILYPYLYAFDRRMMGYVFMVAGEGGALLLTGLMYGIVLRHFSDEIHSFYCGTMEKQYLLLAFIPILMIFMMDEYINSISYGEVVVYDNGEMVELYANHYQMLFIQLLGMGSLFCILFAYKRLLESFRLDTELSLLEQEEHSLNRYVEEAKTRYDETKSFRHDIRNHITVVKKLLQDGKIGQAVTYMEDLDDLAEKMSFPCSTNNPVVDILLGNKLGLAKSMGIRTDCSLLLPYPCGLRDIDICIILSNALDNAIHACRSLDGMEKRIYVSGRIQGDFLMMEIENSFHGKGTFKEGTGLSNIKRVAEKYDGAMSIETQGKVFILHVLLIIPQQPEDSSRQMD